MTTSIAFGNHERTEGNLRIAEKELDENTLGLEEGQIVEERKTLQWLEDELRQQKERESHRRALVGRSIL
jgi:hypothetical protein